MNNTQNAKMLDWTYDEGHAKVPDSPEGHQWIAEANRLMGLPESGLEADCFDDHSAELNNIGGYWL